MKPPPPLHTRILISKVEKNNYLIIHQRNNDTIIRRIGTRPTIGRLAMRSQIKYAERRETGSAKKWKTSMH